MKLCLSFKQLMIAFCVGLAVSSVQASFVRCKRALLSAPSESKVEETIQSLARMQVAVDLAQVEGKDDIQAKALEAEYKTIKEELQDILSLSPAKLQEKLRGYIRLAQKEKNQEQDKITRDKQIQSDSIDASIPNYKLKKRLPIRRLDSGVLSHNGENLFTISTNPNEIHAIKLATGEISVIPYDSVQALSDRILINKDQQWSSLDTNSMTKTSINTSLPKDLQFIRMRASEKKDSILIYSGAMGNGPKDRFNYQHFDHNGKEIGKGDIHTGFSITDVPYMSDQYWVLQSGTTLYKFSPHSKQIEPIAAVADSVFPIPGTSQVITSHSSNTMSLIDLDTHHIQSRNFSKLARPFFANKDLVWVSERDRSSDAHFHMIQWADFTKSDETLPDQPNFVIQEIPGTDWVSFHNQYFNSATRPGIYSLRNLHEPLFLYDNNYELGSGIQIHRQWISKDGQRIVTTVLRKRDVPAVDIWERENSNLNSSGGTP